MQIPDTAPQRTNEIPRLLHGATLLRGMWSEEKRELSLCFDSLRRGTDGSELSDRAVELRLSGVSAIAVAYDWTWPEQRPSQLVLPARLMLRTLVPWPLSTQEVEFHVDSRGDQEQIEVASQVRWLFGGAAQGMRGKKRVSFGFPVEGGQVDGMLWCACESVTTWACQEELDISTWKNQCNAWWSHWREQSLVDHRTHGLAVASHERMRPSTTRPFDPPFDISKTQVAGELLEPIRVWFEAPAAADWAALADVYPSLDSTPQARAQVLADASRGAGPWCFAREARDAWIEGSRAHVRVLGVQFAAPEGDEGACARLVGWSFELRRRGRGWQIRRCVELDLNPEEKQATWLRDWPVGAIRDALASSQSGD